MLDLTEHDDIVLDYVNRVASVLSDELESISIIHVAEDIDIPKAILDKYPGLIPNIDESINQAIDGKIQNFDKNLSF